MLLTVFAALQIGRRLLAATGRGYLACVLTSGRWFTKSALMICFSQCETVFCALEFPGMVSQRRYFSFHLSLFLLLRPFVVVGGFGLLAFRPQNVWTIWEAGGQKLPLVYVYVCECVCLCGAERRRERGRERDSFFTIAALCIQCLATCG